MRLARVSALNALAVATRMGTALALNKVLAVTVGPAGYAVIGQFQNLIGVAGAFASGATGQGVVRYTAEYRDDEAKLLRLWRTAGTVTCVGSTLVGLFLLIFSGTIAEALLLDRLYQPIIVLLALGLVFLALNGVLLAIINGRQDTPLYVRASIAGSLVALAFTVVLTLWQGLMGALAALAINQSLALAATLMLARRERWLLMRNLFGRIDTAMLRNLGHYVAMAGVSALALPVAQIAIRRYLASGLGLQNAGLWDAMTRISAMYLLFFTSTLSIYYLPRIAEIRDNHDLRAEVGRVFAIVSAAVVVASLAIYLLRHLVVRILFDAKFLPMVDLFAPQLIGDTLRLSSWTFAYVMIGRALTTAFIASEIIFNITLVALTVVLVQKFGLVGTSIAYAINYLMYFIFAFVVFRRHTNPT